MKKSKNQMITKGVLFFLAHLLFVYVKNSPLFIKETTSLPLLLTYRGLTQTFSMGRVTNDTSLTERIYQLKQWYMEIAILSMNVQDGADSVRFDIPPIKDG